MTTLTETIATALHLDDADAVYIATSPAGAVRLYAPAAIPKERLQVEFLKAVDNLNIALVTVGRDDHGTYVGFEAAAACWVTERGEAS